MTKEERIFKVLKDINSRVPKLLRDNVVTEQKKFPDFCELLDKAISDPDFPEEKKAYLKIIRNSPQVDKTDTKENYEVVKKIDEFVNREIKKEIKKGNLPKNFKFKNNEEIRSKEITG